MHRQLDIHLLRTLVAIVDTGGFGKAAEALTITQPAVSQHVRRLESMLKGPVFTRVGRDLRLSQQGEQLLSYARRIIAVHDEALSHLQQPRHRSVLSIGVSHQLTGTLRTLLRRLQILAPESRLILKTGLSERLSSQVAAGALDLALLCGPQEQAEGRPIGYARFAWFGRGRFGPGERVPLVVPGERSWVRRQVLETMDHAGRQWWIACECEDPGTLRMAVDAGVGLSWMAAGLGDGWGLRPASALGLPEPKPSPVWLVRSPRLSGQPRSGVMAAIAEALREAAFADGGVAPVDGSVPSTGADPWRPALLPERAA